MIIDFKNLQEFYSLNLSNKDNFIMLYYYKD